MFLSVILDENLTWKQNIGYMAEKISKATGIIYKSNFCLPVTSLCTVNYGLVYPYLVYCVSVWVSTYPTNLKHIVILLKKVICFISKKLLIS